MIAQKFAPLVMQYVSWKLSRSPKMALMLWLLPKLNDPSIVARRTARLQMLQKLAGSFKR